MKDTSLYQKILGLSNPWKVAEVTMDIPNKRIIIHVQCQERVRWADSEGKRAHIHKWHKRQWRHLDTCQFETLIEAEVPSVKYANGTVEEVAVPWAERYCRVTVDMEAFVIQVLQATGTISKAADLLRMGWEQAERIMNRAVERGLMCREANEMAYLGIDEKSIAKGHTYATVVNDLDGSRVIEVVEGRKEENAAALWETFTEEQRHAVKAVAMDMWPAFKNSVEKALPNAVVVHDKFHVAKYLNEAVDMVRKMEHRKLLAVGDETLKGTKYQWLRGYEDMRSKEGVDFRELYKLDLKTSRAWHLKETFGGFWDYYYRGSAEKFFKQWYSKAIRSRLEPIKKVAKMLKAHLGELLNYTAHRITNAMCEGMNSVIQIIKANARGLPNFKNYRTRILFFCGKLNLLPVR